MKSTKQTQITVKTHALSHEGRGIANVNGLTTFIDGALADETILCQITKKHRHYQEAKIVEVLSPSENRITPKCPHFGVCGGCSLQQLDTEHQIQFKQSILLEQLKHFGKTVPEKILPPLVGNPWEYRRKARLGVRYVK